MTRLAQVIQPALVLPAADVLHDVALEVAELVGCNVVPRLNRFGLVVGAADLGLICVFHVRSNQQTCKKLLSPLSPLKGGDANLSLKKQVYIPLLQLLLKEVSGDSGDSGDTPMKIVSPPEQIEVVTGGDKTSRRWC